MAKPSISYTPDGCFNEEWSVTHGDSTYSIDEYAEFTTSKSDFEARDSLMAEGSRIYTFSG